MFVTCQVYPLCTRVWCSVSASMWVLVLALAALGPRRTAVHRARPPISSASEDISGGVGRGRVAIEVDLGKDGEPAGVSRLNFIPQLDRSDFLLLNLRVPLGMLIEETDDGAILVTGAMPGYSSDGAVESGDVCAAVSNP